MNRIVLAMYDREGNGLACPEERHGFWVTVMQADDLADAKKQVLDQGYTLVDFEAPSHAPGEYFGDEQDAWCVNVYTD